MFCRPFLILDVNQKGKGRGETGKDLWGNVSLFRLQEVTSTYVKLSYFITLV